MNTRNDKPMNAGTTTQGLHITIGTTPGRGKRLLEGEIQLLKAALLYADHVLLCSPGSSLVTSLAVFGELASTANQKDQIELTRQLIPSFLHDEAEVENTLAILDMYAGTLSKRGKKQRLTKEELILEYQLRPQFQRIYRGLNESIISIAEDAGLGEIVTALESGMLEFRFLETASAGDDSEELITEYLDVIGQAVAEGVSYPLLDDLTGNLIRASIAEGKLEVPDLAVNRGKHAGLMSDLLGRLPLFDQASVQEVLDIRKELERPLVRFRAAVSKYSDTMGSAQWDKDFPLEAEKIFVTEVQPAVLEIEDAIKSNHYLFQLASRYANKHETLAIPVLAVFMAQFSSLPEIVSLAMGTAAVAAQIVDVYREWKEKQREIEKNQLFFYYRAGRLMEA